MIKTLDLTDVGPVRDLNLSLSNRLNVITGDNGLGKSFVLEVAWWALTGNWPRDRQAYPYRPVSRELTHPLIHATWLTKGSAVCELSATYDRVRQTWSRSVQHPGMPSGRLQPAKDPIVLYVRSDNSYALHDPAQPDPTLVLTEAELWNGRRQRRSDAPGEDVSIAGLLSDLVLWQARTGHDLPLFTAVLKQLSPPGEELTLAEPVRVDLKDKRDIPALQVGDQLTAVTLASAGVRRTLSIAYALTWLWIQHGVATSSQGRKATREVVVLLDEVELHLHPSWQRRMLPALLSAAQTLTDQADVQVVATTHSPLVLASVEPMLDDDLDDLFVLERDGGLVRGTELPFSPQGQAGSWLASRAFGGLSDRSIEAQLAVDAAMDLMADRRTSASHKLDRLSEQLAALPRGRPLSGAAELEERCHQALGRTLPDHDGFWSRWIRTWDRTRA
jgi:hypothetical protein